MDITYGVLNFNPDYNATATAAYITAVESLANKRNSLFKSEVYLIDQGGQSELTAELARKYGFTTLCLPKNVGISRGINLLVNMARGQFISLVTSDTEFTLGLDSALINILRFNPDIWQICPASNNSELEHQRIGYQSSGLAYTLAAQELTIQMWPRSTFEKIGYFDERWKACFENMDFALRIFLAGGNVAVSHDVSCPHKHAMTIKSGARNHTYDNYIHMPDGFNQDILHKMWNDKWPGLSWRSLYEQPPDYDMRCALASVFGYNVYLPYIQHVGY